MTVGSKIREIRTGKQLTLKNVADKTKLTPSYLSQIERNITEPSISALRKVSNALEVPLGTFLTDANHCRNVIIKAEERVKLDLPHSNVIYEFLTPMASEKKIHPKIETILVRIPSNCWTSDEAVSNETDECIIAVSGSVKIEIENETFILNQGDSIYIKESVEHRFFNEGDEEATIIKVLSSPVY